MMPGMHERNMKEHGWRHRRPGDLMARKRDGMMMMIWTIRLVMVRRRQVRRVRILLGVAREGLRTRELEIWRARRRLGRREVGEVCLMKIFSQNEVMGFFEI